MNPDEVQFVKRPESLVPGAKYEIGTANALAYFIKANEDTLFFEMVDAKGCPYLSDPNTGFVTFTKEMCYRIAVRRIE